MHRTHIHRYSCKLRIKKKKPTQIYTINVAISINGLKCNELEIIAVFWVGDAVSCIAKSDRSKHIPPKGDQDHNTHKKRIQKIGQQIVEA